MAGRMAATGPVTLFHASEAPRICCTRRASARVKAARSGWQQDLRSPTSSGASVGTSDRSPWSRLVPSPWNTGASHDDLHLFFQFESDPMEIYRSRSLTAANEWSIVWVGVASSAETESPDPSGFLHAARGRPEGR